MTKKPILCIDFDGVIHRYSKGWQDGEIYDEVTDGFFDWAIQAKQEFKLVIYSSRSKTEDGIAAMRKWLAEQLGAWRKSTVYASEGQADILLMTDDFEFAHEKPPAFLTIDDRAVCFEGKWNGIAMAPITLRHFRTWTQGASA